MQNARMILLRILSEFRKSIIQFHLVSWTFSFFFLDRFFFYKYKTNIDSFVFLLQK